MNKDPDVHVTTMYSYSGFKPIRYEDRTFTPIELHIFIETNPNKKEDVLWFLDGRFNDVSLEDVHDTGDHLKQLDKLYSREDIEDISKISGFDTWSAFHWKQEMVEMK